MKMFTSKIFLRKMKVPQNHSEKQASRKTSIREDSKEKFKRFIAPFQIVLGQTSRYSFSSETLRPIKEQNYSIITSPHKPTTFKNDWHRISLLDIYFSSILTYSSTLRKK